MSSPKTEECSSRLYKTAMEKSASLQTEPRISAFVDGGGGGGTIHIGANQGEIAEICLVPGDPLRAKYVAETYLTDAVQISKTRNMFGRRLLEWLRRE